MALKVIFIVGTRPEAIKLAPVILGMQQDDAHFEPCLIATGQHREMLAQVLDLFKLSPDHDLDIMKFNQNLFEVTTNVLMRLQPILTQENPDLLMVQGDTLSAFSGALAAFYLKIPIAHVEAGLRTYDKFHPFPEEISRRLVSTLADWHFAPTAQARENLLCENVPDERIFVTGNTVVDALSIIQKTFSPQLPQFVTQLHPDQRLLLVTVHRRENWERVSDICTALRRISNSFPEVVMAFSVHPNPNVRTVVHNELQSISQINLLDPVAYATFVHLMARSDLILTDSGGIQEEAPSLGKPVLVLREVTERPEGVKAGVLKVIGTNTESIVSATAQLLDNPSIYQSMVNKQNPFGDGHASENILDILSREFVCES